MSPYRFVGSRSLMAAFAAMALFLTLGTGVDAANEPLAAAAVPATIADGAPVAVAGTLLGTVDGNLAVQETDASAPVAFPLDTRTAVLRGGDVVTLDALRPGDELWMSVDGTTGRVLRITAAPAAAAPFVPSNEAALSAAIGFVTGGVLLVTRNRRPVSVAPAVRQRRASSLGRAALLAGQGVMVRATAPRQPTQFGARS